MDNELKDVLSGIRSSVEGFSTRVDAIQRQVDAIDSNLTTKHQHGFETKSIGREVFENDGFKAFAETGRGRVAIKISDFQERKTAILGSTLGSYATGTVMGERQAGIVPVQLRTFRVRELLRTISTTAAAIDFVRVTAAPAASPQVEGAAKHEAAMTFASTSAAMKTIASWIPVSRQALQDLAGLEESVNVHLLAALADEEDRQLLAGDGLGENLSGLIATATVFDTSLLSVSAGWTRLDVIARAIQQLTTARYPAEGIVLHPTDWWSVLLTKDSTGRYILGDPANMTETRLWGIPVSVSDAISTGTFLLGAFVSGAAIYQRMDAVVEASDSHSDYFTKNMIALRAEERLALVKYKPAGFVTGSFSTSPA